MAALPNVIPHPATRRPTPAGDPKEIVAVVLEDGSVRELRPNRKADDAGRRITNGTVSGRDWILWWTRRTF